MMPALFRPFLFLWQQPRRLWNYVEGFLAYPWGLEVLAVSGRADTSITPMQAATGCGIPTNGPYAGSETAFNLRLAMVASGQSDWSMFVARVGNFSSNTLGDGAGPITKRAALEYPAGQFHPFQWESGGRDVTLAPGAVVDSLPLPIVIPAGQRFWWREFSTLGSGAQWIQTNEIMQTAEGSGVEYGTAGSLADKTTSGTIAAFYGMAPQTPFFLKARPAKRLVQSGPRAGKAVAALELLGDSIMLGKGDIPVDGGSSVVGAIARGATRAGLGWTRTAVSGQRGDQFDTPDEYRRKLYVTEAVTHFVDNYGTNDLTALMAAGSTPVDALAQLKARSIGRAALAHSLGKKIIPVTLTPRTNGANNGCYNSGTSVDTADTIAVLFDYNGWLRTDPHGDGVFDAYKYANDPGTPNKWRTDVSLAFLDGLHPPTGVATAIGDGFAADSSTLII